MDIDGIHVPFEIFLLIFPHLPTFSSRLNFMLASKIFYDEFYDKFLELSGEKFDWLSFVFGVVTNQTVLMEQCWRVGRRVDTQWTVNRKWNIHSWNEKHDDDFLSSYSSILFHEDASALSLAVHFGHLEAVKWLLNHGADYTAYINPDNYTTDLLWGEAGNVSVFSQDLLEKVMSRCRCFLALGEFGSPYIIIIAEYALFMDPQYGQPIINMILESRQHAPEGWRFRLRDRMQMRKIFFNWRPEMSLQTVDLLLERGTLGEACEETLKKLRREIGTWLQEQEM